MRSWKPEIKPPTDICPQEFCWFWQRAGSRLAPGLYLNLEEALQVVTPVAEGGCGWMRGLCTRLDPIHGDQDWYEPHEPRLEAAGLPWFYFIAGPEKLTER